MFKIGIRRLLSRISSIEDKPFHTFHTYQGYIETKREYSEHESLDASAESGVWRQFCRNEISLLVQFQLKPGVRGRDKSSS